ncbi:MAG: twin-arginine translocase TatA/TatE family subunit [Kineosporiaceae bacterium]
MFNINAWEFGVIAIVVMLLLGPDRLPEYAAGLARLIRRGREFARGAREQVRSEMGPEFDEIDWQKYDPRRYHPRSIVRNALSDTFADDDDESPPAPPRTAAREGGTSNGRRPSTRVNGASAGGGAGPTAGASLKGAPRPARTPRPPAVRDAPRRSPEPTSWEEAAKRLGPAGGVDADAT